MLALQAGAGQSLHSRSLVIPLLNRIKVSPEHLTCILAHLMTAASVTCQEQQSTHCHGSLSRVACMATEGVSCCAQDFSEWAQCQVLEAVSGYRPSSEQEVYDIMNVLDDRLLHSNSAVVMATVKLFLHLTLAMPPTHQQVGPASTHHVAEPLAGGRAD